MNLQEGIRLKQAQKNNLFNFNCNLREFKMSSNSVKFDSARKWHRRLGNLNHADMIRNVLETVGKLEDVCDICEHWPRSQWLKHQEWQQCWQRRNRRKCMHSTAEEHTRDYATERVTWRYWRWLGCTQFFVRRCGESDGNEILLVSLTVRTVTSCSYLTHARWWKF